MTTTGTPRAGVRTTPDSPRPPVGVAWRRVALFLVITMGGGWGVGYLLWQVARSLPAELLPLLSLSLAVVYMPLPLVAGLIVERVAGGRPILLRRAWAGLRRPRRWLVLLTAGVLPAAAIAVLSLGLAIVASALGVPGAGDLVSTTTDLAGQLSAISGQEVPAELVSTLPPVPVVFAVSFVQAVVFGATLNAVFALGEEYGWRGVLAEELAPLGALRANLLIGTVWGLWHAPLIIWLGHNFGDHWRGGVPMMVAVCVPFGFVLAWSAARAGVFAAAVGHGVFNGTMGVLLLLVAGANPLVAPIGVVAVAGSTVVALVLWLGFPPECGTGSGPADNAGIAASRHKSWSCSERGSAH